MWLRAWLGTLGRLLCKTFYVSSSGDGEGSENALVPPLEKCHRYVARLWGFVGLKIVDDKLVEFFVVESKVLRCPVRGVCERKM